MLAGGFVVIYRTAHDSHPATSPTMRVATAQQVIGRRATSAVKEVVGGHGAQGHGVGIGTLVTHYAHGVARPSAR